jgi:hypothetical protein
MLDVGNLGIVKMKRTNFSLISFHSSLTLALHSTLSVLSFSFVLVGVGGD